MKSFPFKEKKLKEAQKYFFQLKEIFSVLKKARICFPMKRKFFSSNEFSVVGFESNSDQFGFFLENTKKRSFFF